MVRPALGSHIGEEIFPRGRLQSNMCTSYVVIFFLFFFKKKLLWLSLLGNREVGFCGILFSFSKYVFPFTVSELFHEVMMGLK